MANHLPVLRQEHIPFMCVIQQRAVKYRLLVLQPATPNTGFNLNTTPVTVEVVEQLQLLYTSSGVNDNPVYTYIKWNNSRRGSERQSLKISII
jgi:hypothetical protein